MPIRGPAPARSPSLTNSRAVPQGEHPSPALSCYTRGLSPARPTPKGKILLIEDHPTQAREILGALDRLGYATVWARSGAEGLAFAQSKAPDLTILDVVLGDMDGFAVCRWLKMRPETRDIPVIMLSVQSAIKDRVHGLHLGASDYLTKPCADEELEAHIFAALRVRTAQSELQRRNSELEAMLHHVEAMAITDALTGLYNRRRFTDVLRNQFAVTRRYKHPLSCLMIDIDHFKSINDHHGHHAGDQVLQTVAQRLTADLRRVDLAARYGGEEFAVLLPHTSKENAAVVAHRLLEVARGLEIELDGARIPVTVSIGVSSSTDLAPDAEADYLVRAADFALYRAKSEGRNRVALSEPATNVLVEPATNVLVEPSKKE